MIASKIYNPCESVLMVNVIDRFYVKMMLHLNASYFNNFERQKCWYGFELSTGVQAQLANLAVSVVCYVPSTLQIL